MKNCIYNAQTLIKTVKVFSGFALIALLLTEPAMAQAWSQKMSSVVDEGVTGLRLIGSGIALGCLLWSAYSIIWGGKRLQDMVGWFIGAALCFAAEDIVGLFFS